VSASVLEIGIVALLGSFGVLTFVHQIFTYRLLRVVQRWDVFCLLPNYHLFFAIPRDLRLSIRDRLPAGALTAWRGIPLRSPQPWYQAVWHPQDLAPQVPSSLVEDLVMLVEAPHVPAERLPHNIEYKGLWNYLEHLDPTRPWVARQYSIEEAAGRAALQTLKVVYISAWHLR
jgi:hypothetical protein